jgi:dipeptidyl-peptidase-4
MKAIFKPFLLFYLIFGSQIASLAQQGQLSIELLFSGQLRQERMGAIKWLQQSAGFTKLTMDADGTGIEMYDIAKGEWKALVNPSDVRPAQSEEPLVIEDYLWSHDEKKLLIFTNSERVWRQNTRGDYWVFDLEGNSLRQIGASLPSSSLMFAKFSPNDDKIAYVSQSNLYVEELVGGEITKLSHDGTVDIINGTFDWAYEEEFSCRDGFRWSDDGTMVAYWQVDATDIRDFLMINNTDSLYSYTIPVQYPKVGQEPSSAKIGVVNVATRKTVWMDIPGDSRQHYLPRMQWIPNKKELLVQQLNRKQNRLKIFRCNALTGASKLVYEEEDEAWIELGSNDLTARGSMDNLPFSADEKSFFVMTEKDGWRHMYQVPVEVGGDERLVTPFDYDVAAFYQAGANGKQLFFNASPDNATQRYLYGIATKKNSVAKKITPQEYSGINRYNLSPDGKYAIHSFSSANQPPIHQLVTLPQHKTVQVLIDNEQYSQQVASFGLPEVEFFKVTTSDGVEMDGRIIKPRDFDQKKKYPVLFYVYGEPWGQTATDSWVSLWNHFIAQQGYLVITMDNRGTPAPKGREWRKSIYRKVGVVNSRDQAMAAMEVMKWDYVDADRIAVWGWSGGGSMTLNLLFRYPGIYGTGMAVAAVANQLYYDNIYQERYMGVPWENADDFIEGSPITYAKNLKGNLLLIHGTADDNVHYQNAEALINELVAHNRQFDLMIYPNRSHGIYEGRGTTLHLYSLLYRYLSEHTPPGGR